MTPRACKCPVCEGPGRNGGRGRNPCEGCRRLMRHIGRLHLTNPPCEAAKGDPARLANIGRYAERAAEGAGLFGEGRQ